MQVQNRKLVKILINNQDKPYKHVLKKARDWELLHKRTDNIQEQSGKTLNAMSTYRAGNKNHAFQNQNQRGQNQQNHSNENFGNRRSRSESRNRGRGRKVVRRVDRGIKTTPTKSVTVVANVESVEKIFNRNQSNVLL